MEPVSLVPYHMVLCRLIKCSIAIFLEVITGWGWHILLAQWGVLVHHRRKRGLVLQLCALRFYHLGERVWGVPVVRRKSFRTCFDGLFPLGRGAFCCHSIIGLLIYWWFSFHIQSAHSPKRAFVRGRCFFFHSRLAMEGFSFIPGHVQRILHRILEGWFFLRRNFFNIFRINSSLYSLTEVFTALLEQQSLSDSALIGHVFVDLRVQAFPI